MLHRFYYRFIDRVLDKPVRFPDRQSMGKGDWSQCIGQLGEDLACKYLRRDGVKVLYRNFRADGGGEVDIVAREGQTLVFAEVKARTSSGYGRPALAVDRHKQKLIAKGAVTWLRMLRRNDVPFRFDIIEVELREESPPKIEQLKNAFAIPDKKKSRESWSTV